MHVALNTFHIFFIFFIKEDLKTEPGDEEFFCTMKKKRSIVIKHPELLRIRNNRRKIIIKKLQDTDIELTSEIDAIIRNPEGNLNMDLATSESAELQKLKNKKSQIKELTSKSICCCTACRQIDKDMAYNSTLGEWYCVECTEEFGDCYYQQKIEKQKGKFLGDYNEEFFGTFT